MKAKVINIGWVLLHILAFFWIIGGVIRIILGGLVIYAGEVSIGSIAIASGIIVIALGVLGIRLCDKREAKRQAKIEV